MFRPWAAISMVVEALLVLSFSNARADWPASPLINVPVSVTMGDQSVAGAIADGQGGMIIVWRDSRSGEDDIYAQRLSAAGVVQWTLNGVAVCSANGSQRSPRIVSDGLGGAIIVWNDFGTLSAGDIYAQRLDGNGVKLWASSGVPVCTSGGDQLFPEVVADGTGGGIFVWADASVYGASDYHAQRLNSAGESQWAPGGVRMTSTVVELQPPSIASDDSSGVYVAWHGPGGVSVRAYVQRLDAMGQRRWGGSGIALADTSSQTEPKLVADGAGGVIATYSDYRYGNGTIYAQRVSPDGSRRWASGGVRLAIPEGDQQYQAIVSDGLNGAIVVWSDYTTTQIRAQRVGENGAVLWSPPGVVVCTASGERQSMQIRSDGVGGVLASWFDHRVGGGDVYIQRVTSAGTPLWVSNGVAVCTAQYIQVNIRVVPDGAGGALLAWSDYRNMNWDVYAQNVTANGMLGGSTLDLATSVSAHSLSVRALGPSPSLEMVEVECLLPGEGSAQVRLLDILGRCLEAHAIDAPNAGTHRVAFRNADAIRVPGVLMVELTQAGVRTSTKVVRVR